MSQSRSRTEYLIPTENITVLYLVVAYFFGHPICPQTPHNIKKLTSILQKKNKDQR